MLQRIEYLAHVQPFDRLDHTLLARVAEMVDTQAFAQTKWLVMQGSISDGSLLILTSGKASIVSESDGEERVIGTCQPGDFVGLSGSLTGEPHPVGTRADTAVNCFRIPAEALDLCLASPAFAAFFSRILARRLLRAYTKFSQDHAYRTVGMDTQPFRRRVSDLMRTPPATCTPEMTVGDAARQMRDLRVSSLIVASGNRPIGIVTAADLVTKVVAAETPATHTVTDIMSTPVESIGDNAYYYEVLLLMVRKGIKHVPVVAGDGTALGMVTLGDLARARGEGALRVVDQIERAETVPGLSATVHGIDGVLRSLTAEGGQPSQVLPVLTELYDRLTRRVIALGIENLGEPPCDWCWLTMGSAGREEQFVRSDQDNAIIYADSSGAVDAYFAQLAAFVVGGLIQCGFARCPGDVMATNPAWRRSLEEWRFQVISMVHKPAPAQIRLATIFLDFRPVAGNRGLATSLREQLWVAVESLPLFLNHLVQDDLTHQVPIGPFRRLITPLWGERRGQINLKADACVHVVDLLRALSIKHKIPDTSTFGRLRALAGVGAIARNDVDWLEIAYQTMMRIRMQQALDRIHAGEPPSNYIQVSALSEPERAALRDALVAVARLQESVGMTLAPGGAL